MSSFSISHLLISREESLHQFLTDALEGDVLLCTDLALVAETVETLWPNSIILDGRIDSFSIEWLFSFRDQLSIAEIPIVLLMNGHQNNLESALTFLPRLSIVKPNSHNEIPVFVDILVDEHTRDGYYEQKPNLITLERINKIWQKQSTAEIVYSRSLSNGTKEPGHQLTLYRGGIRKVRDKKRLLESICDPNPQIKIVHEDVIGDWLSVAEVLYHSLKQHSRPGFLRIRQWYGLTPTDQAGSAKDLPIELPTRQFLFQKNMEHLSIAERLQPLGLRSTQVETDIEILVRMGLYKLNVPEKLNTVTKEQFRDLPQVPQHRWHLFLRTTLWDVLHKSVEQNPWSTWKWEPLEPLEPQVTSSLAKLAVLEQLPTLDDQRNLQMVKDQIWSVKEWLKRWQHCYKVLGKPPEEEENLLYEAFTHLKKQNLPTARTVLEPVSHPFPQALKLWLNGIEVLQNPSKIRPILIELSGILEQGNLPIFEAYTSVLQMGMGHWSQAEKRIQLLPPSHQQRALLWCCQTQRINPNLWVFWQW